MTGEEIRREVAYQSGAEQDTAEDFSDDGRLVEHGEEAADQLGRHEHQYEDEQDVGDVTVGQGHGSPRRSRNTRKRLLV